MNKEEKKAEVLIEVGSVNRLKGGDYPTYNIETINDLFQIVTEDNLERVITDLKAMMQLGLDIEKQRLAENPGTERLKVASFNWIDDWSDQDKADHANQNKFDFKLNISLSEDDMLKDYEDRSGMTALKERVGNWGDRSKYWMACSPRVIDGDTAVKMQSRHPVAFWVNYGDDETFGLFSFEQIEQWLSTPDLLLYKLGGSRERIKHVGR